MNKHLFFLLFPVLLLAGNNPKKIFAVRTPVAPTIDGVLNEPEWKLARPVSDFTQRDPAEGAAPTEKTEIRILYDNNALYFACTMYDSDPSKIVSRLSRRDDEIESDKISIRIDSYHDHQTAFEFTILAGGVKVDVLQYNDDQNEDASWDPVWDVRTRITDEGWTAEVRIPFNILRFTEKPEYEWGLQFIRWISRKQERNHWALIRKSESGWVSKFGHLVGLKEIPAPKNLELIPYAVSTNRIMPTSLSYPNGRDLSGNAGFDLKYRPGWLTVDATFNPDFGQVEADPAVLNLSTFETFYPEKRPFFIEGLQIFRFGTFGDPGAGPGMFYTRRLGRALSVSPPTGGYVTEEPRYATILGAAKISGKTPGGLGVGVMEAVTQEEHATLVDSAGRRTDALVEPLANYSVVRLRQDILENSNVGLIATSVNRQGAWPALTGGVDWTFRFMESMYRLDGFLAGSHATNTALQRIDGSAGRISLNKDGGEHWRGFVSGDFTSPTYNINDIGFFRSPDDHGVVSQILYRDDRVRESERFWSTSLQYHYRSNYAGAEIFNQFMLAGDLVFANYWAVIAQLAADWGKYDHRETRGNGLYAKPSNQSYYLEVRTNPQKPFVANGSVQYLCNALSFRGISYALNAQMKPYSNVTWNLSLLYARRSSERAWVANISDPLVSPTTVSIFADRSTTQWNIVSRSSYVFSPELTLQWYFQLFFAQGKYENSARILDPEHFQTYAYAAPDFNHPSFNSNLIVRWEYLPGSTAYLVWSQARSGSRGDYSTPFGDEFSNTFALPMQNVLLLKVSYWWSL